MHWRAARDRRARVHCSVRLQGKRPSYTLATVVSYGRMDGIHRKSSVLKELAWRSSMSSPLIESRSNRTNKLAIKKLSTARAVGRAKGPKTNPTTER